jgi:hypothetical protein
MSGVAEGDSFSRRAAEKEETEYRKIQIIEYQGVLNGKEKT